MAFIFRHRRRKSGKIVLSENFYVRFRDPLTRKLVTFPGYPDRQSTETLAQRLYLEACRHAEGLGPPASVRKGGETLAELRVTFRQSTLDQGRTRKHADLTDQRLATLFAGCKWKLARDLNEDAAKRYLAQRRVESKRFGVESTNHYLRAAKMFSRWWAIRARAADPFFGMKLLNAETDRRHKRRALSGTELVALLKAAAASRDSFRGLTGTDRAELYHAAAWSGMRAGELDRLTPADLDFAARLVAISAEQKKRKETASPIHRDLIAMLRRRADVAAARSSVLWPGTWLEKAALMIRKDLKAAGIPYQTERGFADFHSLRKTFNTLLAKSGVALTSSQQLLRHSDPELTANVYTELGDKDLAAELNKLPSAHTLAHTRERKRVSKRNAKVPRKSPRKPKAK